MGPKVKVKSGVKVRVEKVIVAATCKKDKEYALDNNNNNEIVDRKHESININLSSIKKENVSIKEDDKGENQIWLVGDLVWSKIPGHCWWPSMVSYDPCDAIYFTKSKNGRDAVKYHVQFFGDKSLRGWVSKGNMIRFQGKFHFFIYIYISKYFFFISLKKPTILVLS